ncbi:MULTISPECIES: hypothetical protein [unclassified Aurantimonas]|uniref:hypothetical protein n=1 Tax=unclassified Aurantimonas TaxID=2638230 RepID=UPI002E16CB75|nr:MULTISPECIES: hypothetical protein [unclassified Aurantimonas]MEC5291562.1 hypothetical protein [Aurantimonas sp. C2-3-R2]MEC5412646.1 hypothetical protein [Aurantimonas sp. C2-4-R8]
MTRKLKIERPTRHQTTIRMRVDLRRELHKAARLEGRSASNLIEQLVTDGLKRLARRHDAGSADQTEGVFE